MCQPSLGFGAKLEWDFSLGAFLIGQLILNQSFDPTDLFRQHKPTMARYRGYANYHVRNNYHARDVNPRPIFNLGSPSERTAHRVRKSLEEEELLMR